MNWNEFQSVATRPQELMSPAGTGRKGGLRRGNNADCRTLQIHHLGGGGNPELCGWIVKQQHTTAAATSDKRRKRHSEKLNRNWQWPPPCSPRGWTSCGGHYCQSRQPEEAGMTDYYRNHNRNKQIAAGWIHASSPSSLTFNLRYLFTVIHLFIPWARSSGSATRRVAEPAPTPPWIIHGAADSNSGRYLLHQLARFIAVRWQGAHPSSNAVERQSRGVRQPATTSGGCGTRVGHFPAPSLHFQLFQSNAMQSNGIFTTCLSTRIVFKE